MKTIEISEATGPLADYARTASSNPVIVTLEGKPIAAVVSIENADQETVSLSTNPKFLALVKRSFEKWKKGKGISTEEMRRRLGAQ